MSKARLGQLIEVKNSSKKPFPKKQADNYFAVWVSLPGGQKKCLLLTASDLAKAELRSEKNPEDLTQRSVISKILD